MSYKTIISNIQYQVSFNNKFIQEKDHCLLNCVFMNDGHLFGGEILKVLFVRSVTRLISNKTIKASIRVSFHSIQEKYDWRPTMVGFSNRE